MRHGYLFLAVSLFFTLGCGGKETRYSREPQAATKAVDGVEDRANQDGADKAKGGAAQGPAEPEVPRKIIYTAQVDLIVDDFEQAGQAVKQLVEDKKGYVAKSELHGAPGSPRSGNWTVRVPVDHFQAFMDAVAHLGELRRGTTDSDDITDKYYDLQAHIKTNEVEEEGLQKLYLEKSASAKLPDLVPIRHELREIRGEIEAQKGQLTRWDKETQYATVTVNLQDRKDYVPPTSPDFGTSIARTFHGSIGALVDFGKGIVIVVVALAPWLPLLAAVLVPVWLLFRRLARRLPGGGTPTP